jgi:uncharacterized caspase-like protein
MKITAAIWTLFPLIIAFFTQNTYKPDAPAETAKHKKKIAFLVGVSHYQSAPQVGTAINDVTDMSSELTRMGFQVYTTIDPTASQMNDELDSFYTRTKDANISLFYFAGHSLGNIGSDYLLLKDADPDATNKSRRASCSVDDILHNMQQQGVNTNIMLLDISRLHPTKKVQRSFMRQKEPTDALPTSTQVFIGYGASPGEQALSGEGRNSVFTAALLKNMQNPRLSLDKLFNEVNKEVRSVTSGQQIPCKSSTMVKDLYLAIRTE